VRAPARRRAPEGAEEQMKKLALLISVVAVIALVTTPVAQAAADGKALFDGKCAMCHGKDGVAKPMAKGSANFNDAKWQEATKAEAIETVITDGKGKMKGYKDKMTAEEIKAVGAYVKTIK
jgi:cytochrome c6